MSSDFAKKLVNAFLEANIPLHKLAHPSIRQLFQETGRTVPSATSCRNVVDQLSQEAFDEVRKKLSNKKIFLMVDESEVSGAKFVNVLVGSLDNPHITYLWRCEHMESAINAQLIIHQVDDAVKDLGVARQDFSLLVSDAARYMVCAAQTLKQLYPTLFHVTCVAHLLHNCAMKIRGFYKEVDFLIAQVKASTVKSKQRRSLFAEIGYPPQTIVTRWASWLQAAFYYAEHLPAVRRIVEGYDDDGILVQRAKESVEDSCLPRDLLTLKRNYTCIADLVKRIESSRFTCEEAARKLAELDFGNDPCGISDYIGKRLENNDLLSIVNMTNDEVSPATYNLLQKCQPTTAAVERSFSMLNKLLAKDRNFSPSNVKKYLIKYLNCSSQNSLDHNQL